MKDTIYFYEAFEEEQDALKKLLPENITAGFTWKTIQEAGHTRPPASIISTRTQSLIPPEWASDVRAFISRSTGYDHLHAYRTLTGSKAAMGHLPLYCNRAVAEQALMLWLMLLRGAKKQIRQFNTFTRDGMTGTELRGKRIAVYGVGNIGYQVLDIARALGMETLGVDLVRKHDDVDYTEPFTAAARADVLVAAMNLTTENRAYFDNAFWAHTKPGAVFVNISRGELAPSTQLLQAMDDGILSGIALDVFDAEKDVAAFLRDGIESDNPQVKALLALREKENVILTPHNAFNTHESVARKSEQTIQQLKSFLETGQLIWAV